MKLRKKTLLDLFVCLALLSVLFLAGAVVPAPQVAPSLSSGLRWRMIGPFRGGRALAAAGIPGQPNVFYFGAVAGGIWKTANAGRTWEPLFQHERVASIGALAIAPSDPNVIYIGTGEADMRSDITFGDGVYKSADGGRTWQHLGLDDTRHIGRVLVDPRDSNVVLVAALGHAYGPNAERGVFRSADGGRTWQKVLYKDENTGAADLCFDPGNPRVVYATLWRARRPPWSTYPPLGGPGSALYKSTDGGFTWNEISGHGLPTEEVGRMGVAVARGGNRVYLIADAKQGGMYRSDDAGESWVRVGTDRRVWGRGWYFGRVFVDPQNPDVLYVPNVSLYRSTDAGKNFTAIKGAPGGDDYHFLWIDPADTKRMIVASDQGTVVSMDGGQTWSSWYNQPTAQLYHVTTDNRFPYRVYGAQQDSGTVSTTSRSNFGQITFRDWHPIGAGESGYIAPDPRDPKIIYGGSTYGRLFRFDERTGQSQDISPEPTSSFGVPISERRLRFTWTSPLVFSPQNPGTLFFGAQRLLETTNGGRSWREISPDLTGAKKAPAGAGEPPSVETARAQGYGVIYTIAPSPVAVGEIWVGADTGLIHLTRDGGKTWSDVTPHGLADWSKISLLEASPHDAATAYAAVDRHRLDDFAPYVYRTHDYGKTWKKITSGITAPAFVRAVREDPVRKGLLFAGSELGVYVSFDDGDHWQPLQLNLPTAPIRDLVVHGNDLVVATHGRSFWILDDISPLRQSYTRVAQSDAYLFKPAAAIRIRRNVSRDTPLPPETPTGENPPTGAILYYYLREPTDASVTMEILNEKGAVVRTFSSEDKHEGPQAPPAFPNYWLRPSEPLAKDAGLHRFVWDLRYPKPPALSRGYTIAAVPGQDTPTLPLGPLVLPGMYAVRLMVAGHTFTQPLEVKMDPRVMTPPAGLAAQFALGMKIQQAVEEDDAAYRRVESLREQLLALKQRLERDTRMKKVASVVAELDQKAKGLAGTLRGGDGTESTLVRVNAVLSSLAEVVDSADRAPTSQAEAAFSKARKELNSLLSRWKEMQDKDLPALNSLISGQKIPPLALNRPPE